MLRLQQCRWCFSEIIFIGDKFEMLITDSLHWKITKIPRKVTNIRDRIKSFWIFFELCALCIRILQAFRNRLRQTIFRNLAGNTLFQWDHIWTKIEISSKKCVLDWILKNGLVQSIPESLKMLIQRVHNSKTFLMIL